MFEFEKGILSRLHPGAKELFPALEAALDQAEETRDRYTADELRNHWADVRRLMHSLRNRQQAHIQQEQKLRTDILERLDDGLQPLHHQQEALEDCLRERARFEREATWEHVVFLVSLRRITLFLSNSSVISAIRFQRSVELELDDLLGKGIWHGKAYEPAPVRAPGP